MTLGDFDPKAVYDGGATDYERAAIEWWQHLSERTIERLRVAPGARVLDVPCGTGLSLVPAARAAGPSALVVGVDVAPTMLEISGRHVTSAGLGNVALTLGDMTRPSHPPQTFDAVVCVLGIFFVDDMASAARALYDVLRRDGTLAIAVFGEHFCDPMRVVFREAVARIAPEIDVVEPWRRTETIEELRAVFAGGGIEDVTIETDDDLLPLSSAGDWWRIVLGSGLRAAVTELGPERAESVRAICSAYIEDNDVREVLTRSRYALARR